MRVARDVLVASWGFPRRRHASSGSAIAAAPFRDGGDLVGVSRGCSLIACPRPSYLGVPTPSSTSALCFSPSRR